MLTTCDFNNNDYILIAYISDIFLYSYKNNSVLKVIKNIGVYSIISIYRINENEFYLKKYDEIFYLDIKKEKFIK